MFARFGKCNPCTVRCVGTARAAQPDTSAVLIDVLRGHPEVLAALETANEAAWESVDPCLLELARLRVAMLLGCAAEFTHRSPVALSAGFNEQQAEHLALWPTSALFGPVERACLAFTEEFVFDVANLSNRTAEDVREYLGDAGLADFTTALLVVEQRQRLRLTWEKLFPANIDREARP